jgi:hypothetical protein
MKIELHRKYKKDGYTIGKLYINGKTICDTLEDEDRGLTQDMTEEEIRTKKVYGKTAVPIGKYKVVMTWSNRFRREMPLLLDVKGFSGIRIHAGNTAEDTEGCILCGMNSERGKVLNSRVHTEHVYTYIRNGMRDKDGVTIDIHY